MKFNFRQGGSWNQGTLKKRENGQWVTVGGSDDDTTVQDKTLDGGFDWDQTFTDTSWVDEADKNDALNVEKVTTLDYRASGGLEEAVNNADSYPTVVVFEVGGVISLNADDNFHIENGPVWVAGETAPYPGISIIRGRCRVYANEVILSHIGVFPGDETSTDRTAIVHDGEDIITDHCTAMWGTDENAGASNPVDRSSFINTIIGEGLYDSIHPEGTHSRGLLYNDWCEEICIMGNLFAHNNRRHPMTRADTVIANNYTYNFGKVLMHFNGSNEPNISSVGNLLNPGVDSDSDRAIHDFSARLYVDDVVAPPDDRPMTDGSQTMVNEPPIWPSGLDRNDILPSDEVEDYVIANVGPRPAERPPVEADLITNRLEDPHGLIDSQADVGGYPDYDPTTRTLDVPSSGLRNWIQDYTDEVELGV